jgi:hypothetical protein
MLLKLYPRVHRRYTSLPVLGPVLNGFGWLLKRGYATDCVQARPLDLDAAALASWRTDASILKWT